jgi:hypothetical protein
LTYLSTRVGHGAILRGVTDERTGRLRGIGGHLSVVTFDAVGHSGFFVRVRIAYEASDCFLL